MDAILKLKGVIAGLRLQFVIQLAKPERRERRAGALAGRRGHT